MERETGQAPSPMIERDAGTPGRWHWLFRLSPNCLSRDWCGEDGYGPIYTYHQRRIDKARRYGRLSLHLVLMILAVFVMGRTGPIWALFIEAFVTFTILFVTCFGYSFVRMRRLLIGGSLHHWLATPIRLRQIMNDLSLLSVKLIGPSYFAWLITYGLATQVVVITYLFRWFALGSTPFEKIYLLCLYPALLVFMSVMILTYAPYMLEVAAGMGSRMVLSYYVNARKLELGVVGFVLKLIVLPLALVIAIWAAAGGLIVLVSPAVGPMLTICLSIIFFGGAGIILVRMPRRISSVIDDLAAPPDEESLDDWWHAWSEERGGEGDQQRLTSHPSPKARI